VCIHHRHDSARHSPSILYITNEKMCYYVQLERLVKELILPLEKQIRSEQEEKQVVENETQEIFEIVGQKRRARGTGTSSSASKEIVAAGGTRRSKRAKVAPTRYAPVVEEESRITSPRASSGIVTMHTTLTASPPLENSIASDESTMNGNEDTNLGSPRRVSAVAAATRVHKGKKRTFDERFKDLMAFKAEVGHCNVPTTRSSNNKHYSLGWWCSDMRRSYKTIKEEGGVPRCKLSKADIQRLENAGFEWNLSKKVSFDERLKDLMAFKAEFGHCNVPATKSRNRKYYSLGKWCDNRRLSYKCIKEGRSPKCKLSKADIQRLENAGFEWNLHTKFDEHLRDLMAFKAEFGHCNVTKTRSRDNKHYSLGKWCYSIRMSYKAIKKGGMPSYKLSKGDIKRLEETGFEWRFK
jgi:hypothetical protein